jgi:hypothetical protein
VRCTERPRQAALVTLAGAPRGPARWMAWLLAAVAGTWLAGCGSRPSAPPSAPPNAPSNAPATPPAGVPAAAPVPSGGGTVPGGAGSAAALGTGVVPAVVVLPPPRANRTWDEFREQAARRLVQANPQLSYTSPAPDPLLAIPVLQVELNADGSVRQIRVLRMPRQAQDTVELAMASVRRAAPFGDVSRLSKPWIWTEVFLFDDQRRFKPRILD